MEMEMKESPTKVMENYSDASFDSSGGTGGSFSPPLKRLRKASIDTTTTTADDDTHSKTSSTRSSISEEFDGTLLSQPSDLLQAVILTSTCTTAADADDDTDNKTSSTRSSISEEFGGPHLLQPSDPLQQTAVGEEIGKRRCTTIEEYVTNDYSWEECRDFLRSIGRQPESQPETEIWRVDPDWLGCYARQALDYLKAKTGEDYFYEGPRSMCLCSLPDSDYKITHINFFARPRCGKTSESLFFAALEHGPIRKVVECCTVPLFKAGDGVVPCIKHPPHVDCSECSKFGDAALCFEVEEEPCCMSWSSWSSGV